MLWLVVAAAALALVCVAAVLVGWCDGKEQARITRRMNFWKAVL